MKYSMAPVPWSVWIKVAVKPIHVALFWGRHHGVAPLNMADKEIEIAVWLPSSGEDLEEKAAWVAANIEAVRADIRREMIRPIYLN